jgi:hypothetical protein
VTGTAAGGIAAVERDRLRALVSRDIDRAPPPSLSLAAVVPTSGTSAGPGRGWTMPKAADATGGLVHPRQ